MLGGYNDGGASYCNEYSKRALQSTVNGELNGKYTAHSIHKAQESDRVTRIAPEDPLPVKCLPVVCVYKLRLITGSHKYHVQYCLHG